jgi:hypothetical protein
LVKWALIVEGATIHMVPLFPTNRQPHLKRGDGIKFGFFWASSFGKKIFVEACGYLAKN